MQNQQLKAQARAIAANARAFTVALERAPADQKVALDDLEQAGKEWVARATSLPGFAGHDSEPTSDATFDEVLAAVEADIDVAGLLLAAGVTAQEVDNSQDSPHLLKSSVQRLEESLERDEGAGGLTAGFAQDPGSAPAESGSLIEAAHAAMECVVQETMRVLKDAKTRLSDLLPDAVAKASELFDAILDSAPSIGRFIRLGLQALKRALLTLQELLPESLRTKAKEFAGEWWTKNGAQVEQTIVGHMVGAPKVEDALSALPQGLLQQETPQEAMSKLVALMERYKRLAQTYARILGALAAAVGVAALISALAAAVASWVPLAAAVGYLLIAGSVIAFGRDYLDTGGLLARVDGVQEVIRTTAAQA